MSGITFTGHMAYLGMLHVEHHHTNPVMRVFCHFLVDALQEQCPSKKHAYIESGSLQNSYASVGTFSANNDGHEDSVKEAPPGAGMCRGGECIYTDALHISFTKLSRYQQHLMGGS